MVETAKLEELLRKHRIIMSYAPLDNSILGFYYCDGNYRIILINNSIKTNERLFRSVLSEEIGHHMTTYGDITKRKHSHYCYDSAVDKHEETSIKWAVDFLIPTASLLSVLKEHGFVSSEELEDYFCVTSNFLMQKFKSMLSESPVWDIDSERFLYLYNFPSICILNSPKDNESVLEEIINYK